MSGRDEVVECSVVVSEGAGGDPLSCGVSLRSSPSQNSLGDWCNILQEFLRKL